MTRLAIMAAMPEELDAFLAAMPDEAPQMVGERQFWCGHLMGHDVVAVLSGIGKVAASITATTLITRFGVDRLIFTGVAGGLGDGVRVGDVVVATELLQHDLDASPLFPRFEIPGRGISRITTNTTLSDVLTLAAHDCLKDAARVHQGLIVSGDRFVSTSAESAALRQALGAAGHQVLAVEMEGAAVAQVCRDYGLPFAAVRTISDRADDSAHVDFPHFVRHVASRYADHIIQGVLQSLSK